MSAADLRAPRGRKGTFRLAGPVFALLERSAVERGSSLNSEVSRLIERGQTLDAIEQAQTSIFSAQVQIQQLVTEARETLKTIQTTAGESDQKQRERLQKIVDWIQKLSGEKS